MTIHKATLNTFLPILDELKNNENIRFVAHGRNVKNVAQNIRDVWEYTKEQNLEPYASWDIVVTVKGNVVRIQRKQGLKLFRLDDANYVTIEEVDSSFAAVAFFKIYTTITRFHFPNLRIDESEEEFFQQELVANKIRQVNPVRFERQ